MNREQVERIAHATVVSAAQSATCGAIDDQVAVANLHYVGGRATTRALSAAVPAPAIVGDEASSARSECVVLAVALGNGRRIVYIGSTRLCLDGNATTCHQAN